MGMHKDAAEVQDGQPEILVGGVLLAEVKFEGFAQAVQGVGARVHFAAFDALDGARADFTPFSQLLLRQSFLLAQFRDFESEVRLVHGLLLSNLIPIIGNAALKSQRRVDDIRTTFGLNTRHFICFPDGGIHHLSSVYRS